MKSGTILSYVTIGHSEVLNDPCPTHTTRLWDRASFSPVLLVFHLRSLFFHLLLCFLFFPVSLSLSLPLSFFRCLYSPLCNSEFPRVPLPLFSANGIAKLYFKKRSTSALVMIIRCNCRSSCNARTDTRHCEKSKFRRCEEARRRLEGKCVLRANIFLSENLVPDRGVYFSICYYSSERAIFFDWIFLATWPCHRSVPLGAFFEPTLSFVFPLSLVQPRQKKKNVIRRY